IPLRLTCCILMHGRYAPTQTNHPPQDRCGMGCGIVASRNSQGRLDGGVVNREPDGSHAKEKRKAPPKRGSRTQPSNTRHTFSAACRTFRLGCTRGEVLSRTLFPKERVRPQLNNPPSFEVAAILRRILAIQCGLKDHCAATPTIRKLLQTV